MFSRKSDAARVPSVVSDSYSWGTISTGRPAPPELSEADRLAQRRAAQVDERQLCRERGWSPAQYATAQLCGLPAGWPVTKTPEAGSISCSTMIIREREKVNAWIAQIKSLNL